MLTYHPLKSRKHCQQIEAIILQFNPVKAAAIKESQTKFQDVSVETALTIHSNHQWRTVFSLAQSLQIVDEVNSLLQAIRGAINEPVKNKFERVLKKHWFYQIKTNL
ncbi:hypothetical protein NQ318_003404 [Aromia moschata]|uniref:Uncharacterized protein n=1 Tax=Aromia moschata TaxID=1265417 RepID=A0AAV8X4S1_9CUCU|nr:hypothetical protein NQ318_003404 [Aromia moschata]